MLLSHKTALELLWWVMSDVAHETSQRDNNVLSRAGRSGNGGTDGRWLARADMVWYGGTVHTPTILMVLLRLGVPFAYRLPRMAL
jgi:hypothetical protein